MSVVPADGRAPDDPVHDSLASYAALVDHIPQSVFIKNAQGVYLAANRRYAESLGRSPGEIIGLDDYALHPREWADKYRSDDLRVMREGRVQACDETLVQAGRSLTIHTVKTPILDAAGRVVGVCGIFWDVGEQRLLERRLRDSEATLRVIYDQAQEGILVASLPPGRLLMANPASCRMLGYEEAELLVLPPDVLHPPEALKRVRQLMARLNLGDHSLIQELAFRRKNGELFYADVSPSLVVLGEQRCLLAVLRDVTDKRRALDQLARSEGLLAEAQTLAHLGNWNVDLRSGQSSWSDEEYRLFGFAPGSVRPSEALFKQVVHPDDYERVEAEIARVLRAGPGHPYRAEFRVLRPDGERILEEVGEVKFDAEGQPLRMFGTTLDVTERRRAARALAESEQRLKQLNEELEQRVQQRTAELLRAKQEAERANAAKSEFLSRMSHELRTPLNAILGFGQLLDMQAREPATRDYLREILKAGDHLLELINEVLDLARIESGKFAVQRESVTLQPLLADCLSLLGPQARARGIELPNADAACRAWQVWADPVRLKQVLLNLLSNAIKYNRPGGRVGVGCRLVDERPRGARLRLTVADSGAGLAPEQQARLFVPFERLEADRAAVEGTGIGLAIAKRLMELMEGAIGIDSRLGEGSEFWIELPLAPAPSPSQALVPPQAVPQPPGPAAAARLRLLCIEDNAANLQLIQGVLALRPQVELLSALHPEEGLALARAQRPALVLLDINLPEMDGYEVLRRLRADPATRTLPVVAISANAKAEDLARGRAAGFDDYLTKPLEVARLLALVDGLAQA